MKKRMLLIMLILGFCGNCYAQSSTLSIVSEKEPFILYLNSINIIPIPNTAAVVDGLKIGQNHVRLVFAKKGIPDLNAQIELVNDGKLHQLSYKVVKDPADKLILKFFNDNSVSMLGQEGGAAQPQESSENMRPSISSTDVNTSSSASMSDKESKSQVSITISQTSIGRSTSESTTDNRINKSDQKKNSGIPSVSDGLMCPNPTVDAQTFLKLKYKISNMDMEMYKARDIIDFMNKQCMLSAQVADLVKIIQMNDYQYEVAQLGYLRTYDQSKYSVVIDALMADFNKEKLLNFIGSNQTLQTTQKTHQNANSLNNDNYITKESKDNTNHTGTSGSTNNLCIPMESADFDEAFQAVDDPINENNKLEVAKSVFDKECLSTNQVYRIVDLFIDENRKLDFAKFAYSRTSDKDKYFRINKAFIDERRITELSNFVKNNR